MSAWKITKIKKSSSQSSAFELEKVILKPYDEKSSFMVHCMVSTAALSCTTMYLHRSTANFNTLSPIT